ncbi:MAG: AAA family ATPase, partial [Frankiales bacterium]|nr:AAA family ATPase [Frankiales bacterium]
FAVSPVPPFTVKGKVAPVHVTEVGAALPPRAAHADLPLVGRNDEVQVLLRALDRARQGSGRHLELVAPPGAGKSRLLAELRDASAGTPVITIVAELYRAAAAYSLVRPLLLQALAVEGSSDGDMVEAVQGWCERRAPSLRPWLPLLSPVLGVELPATPESRDLAPEFRTERLHRIVADVLAVAFPGPTVIVVDDMQFADDASRELLTHLSEVVHERPWLIVQAGRAASRRDRPRPAWSEVLELAPLTDDAALVLVTADTDDAPLAPHVANAVVQRAAGNPLFLRQLAAAAGDVADLAELPDSIESVVAARIDQLRPPARDVLRAVAVAGMSVERDLLLDLLDGESTSAVDVIDELREFVSVSDRELRFHQPVIRDTAYAGLAYRRRAVLHGRLAALLSSRHPDTSAIDAMLSVHYLNAGEHRRALTAASAAADRAALAYANAEAALLYERALTAAGRLGDLAPKERATLLEHLGDARVRLGEFEAGDRCFTAAARLQAGDRVAIARLGLKRVRSADRRGAYGLALSWLRRVSTTLSGASGSEAADLDVEVLMRTAFTQFRQGRLDRARASCLAVTERAVEARTPELLADALALLDLVDISLGGRGDDQRARRALHLHSTRGDLAGQARVLTQIGYRAYLDGRWNDAVSAYGQARELVERLGDLPNVAVAGANTAEILLDQGHLADAESALLDAIRVWRAAGADNDVAFGRAQLARVLARQGRYAEGDALLDLAREQFVAQGARTEVVDADAYRAESLLMQRRFAEALPLAEATLAAAERLSEQPVQAVLLLRVLGGCLDGLGRTVDADRAFAQALDLARRRGADHEVAFTERAMVTRARGLGRTVDPALIAELVPLQRRLGIVVDVTDGAAAAAPVVLPKPRPAADEVSLRS